MKVTLLMEVETVYRSRHLWRKKYSVEVETVYESDTIDGSRDSL